MSIWRVIVSVLFPPLAVFRQRLWFHCHRFFVDPLRLGAWRHCGTRYFEQS